MMKAAFYSILLFLGFARLQPLCAQTGSDIIASMHKRYYHAPCKCYTFSQKNTHYRNDSVTGHSEWHEAIEFPDKFRIDFGDKANGNFVIFKNDSVYNYKKGNFVKSRPDSNTLLLVLGGMYYRELSDALQRLQQAGYDLSVLSHQTWQNKAVYVIGAKENDLGHNQLWVDKKTLNVLRIVEKLNDSDTMDMRFEGHQASCNGFVENKVSFRRNGKLEQLEEYYNIEKAERFPDK